MVNEMDMSSQGIDYLETYDQTKNQGNLKIK